MLLPICRERETIRYFIYPLMLGWTSQLLVAGRSANFCSGEIVELGPAATTTICCQGMTENALLTFETQATNNCVHQQSPTYRVMVRPAISVCCPVIQSCIPRSSFLHDSPAAYDPADNPLHRTGVRPATSVYCMCPLSALSCRFRPILSCYSGLPA